MSLETKTLQELTEIKSALLERINSNPDHSGMERMELADVEAWIELRVKEAERAKLSGDQAT